MALSPLDHEPYESFTEAMYFQKRRQMEAWGTNVPQHVLDDYNYWAEKYRARIARAMSPQRATRFHYMSPAELFATPEWKEIERKTFEMGKELRKWREIEAREMRE